MWKIKYGQYGMGHRTYEITVTDDIYKSMVLTKHLYISESKYISNIEGEL